MKKEFFSRGDRVNVTARSDDMFFNDFTGHVVGFSDEFVLVNDQNDECWVCDPEQLELNND